MNQETICLSSKCDDYAKCSQLWWMLIWQKDGLTPSRMLSASIRNVLPWKGWRSVHNSYLNSANTKRIRQMSGLHIREATCTLLCCSALILRNNVIVMRKDIRDIVTNKATRQSIILQMSVTNEERNDAYQTRRHAMNQQQWQQLVVRAGRNTMDGMKEIPKQENRLYGEYHNVVPLNQTNLWVCFFRVTANTKTDKSASEVSERA